MDKEFVCYHITTKDRLPSILKDGLKPNSKPNWFKLKTPYIMLSKYPYWWLYQNREAWGLKPVDGNNIILLEIKNPEIKPEYFVDPEGLRWGKNISLKYINAVIEFKVNADFEALKGR